MNKKEIIDQLKELKRNTGYYVSLVDYQGSFKRHIKALEYAIGVIDEEETKIHLRDLKYNFENFTEIETADSDLDILEYVINKLENEDSKCISCKENDYMLIFGVTGDVRLCKKCLDRLKRCSL